MGKPSPTGKTYYDDLFPAPVLRRIVWLKKSGHPYPAPNEEFMLRGLASGPVFVEDTKGWSAMAAAHEIGHKLDLATANEDGGHDLPPYPPEVEGDNPNGVTPPPVNAQNKPQPESAVMASGTPQLIGGVKLLPWLQGRWMRHEDWKAANFKAGTIGP